MSEHEIYGRTTKVGQLQWQLLVKRLVELKIVENISDETVRKALKKSASNPG